MAIAASVVAMGAANNAARRRRMRNRRAYLSRAQGSYLLEQIVPDQAFLGRFFDVTNAVQERPEVAPAAPEKPEVPVESIIFLLVFIGFALLLWSGAHG